MTPLQRPHTRHPSSRRLRGIRPSLLATAIVALLTPRTAPLADLQRPLMKPPSGGRASAARCDEHDGGRNV